MWARGALRAPGRGGLCCDPAGPRGVKGDPGATCPGRRPLEGGTPNSLQSPQFTPWEPCVQLPQSAGGAPQTRKGLRRGVRLHELTQPAGPSELGEPAPRASLRPAHGGRLREGADRAAWRQLPPGRAQPAPLTDPQTAGDRPRAWNHSCVRMTGAELCVSRDGQLCHRDRRHVQSGQGPRGARGGPCSCGWGNVSRRRICECTPARPPAHRGGGRGQGSAGGRLATATTGPRTRLPGGGHPLPCSPVENEGPVGGALQRHQPHGAGQNTWSSRTCCGHAPRSARRGAGAAPGEGPQRPDLAGGLCVPRPPEKVQQRPCDPPTYTHPKQTHASRGFQFRRLLRLELRTHLPVSTDHSGIGNYSPVTESSRVKGKSRADADYEAISNSTHSSLSGVCQDSPRAR